MDESTMKRVAKRVRDDIAHGTATIYVRRDTYARLHAIAEENRMTVSDVVDQMTGALEGSRVEERKPTLAEVPR